MILTKSWASYFQAGTRSRGRILAQSDAVHLLPVGAGQAVHAQVHDSSVYTVTLEKTGSALTPQCDCPQFSSGAYCEHLWAVLLHIERQPQEGVASRVAQVELSVPKARRRASGRSAQASDRPQWLSRLSLLRPAQVSETSLTLISTPIARQLCYFISSDLCRRHNGLVVEICQRQPTATGWSRLKAWKISPALVRDLPNADDREICSMLLGANWAGSLDEAAIDVVSDRQRAVYHLMPGAWRAMARMMIETGRCYLGQSLAGSVRLLQWDGPKAWQAWLVGDLDEEGLSLRMEARRGHERLAIERPEVVLCGSDGLLIDGDKVAPFDDRGAHRWVVQYRSGLSNSSTNETTGPIQVPNEDIHRFLDRLYLLPNLPEIDFPEELDRPMLRMDPIPHLEVFSSSASGTAGGKATRGRLEVHVWFAYGQARVLPGQTGRFVSTAAVQTPANAVNIDQNTVANEDATDHEEQIWQTIDGQEEKPPQTGGLVCRNTTFEQQALGLLVSLGFRQAVWLGSEPLTLPASLLPKVAAVLLEQGWVVMADRHAVRRPGAVRLSVASGVDWFEVHGGVAYQTEDGVQEIALPQILEAARSGQRMIRLGDGSNAVLPEQWLAEHGMLATIGQMEDDHLVFKNSQAVLLDTLLKDQDNLVVDETFARARDRIKSFDGISPIAESATFHGLLRPYQQLGLGWMRFLRWFGMGGVLADDMGLGKTIQVLSMLESLYTAGPEKEEIDRVVEHRPSLIVVPRSVVYNWVDEAARFAPKLRVQAYTGQNRSLIRETFGEQDIIITSYGLLRRDIDDLTQDSFEYFILDEAQAIKNPGSQSAKAVKQINARYRLALTGTPVENHLGDLWSIFEFLNPGMLGSNTHFAQLVRGELSQTDEESDIDQEADELTDPTLSKPLWTGRSRLSADPQLTAQIAQSLRPFILRRTKKQVLDDLPEKSEHTILCEMEPAQRQVYDDLLRHYRTTLLEKDLVPHENGAEPTHRTSSLMVLEALLRLRQAACHPGLIDPSRVGEPSAKIEVLTDMLVELIDEGHKTLVFSQFTSMLAIVRTRLDELGIAYEYLDGQTQDRKRHVERFQNDPACPVFLISLKAGGLGLNLTSADYVFILDPWWNPAVEAQAIDRAHRIGQTQRVFAYRLICENTVEQRIADLQQKKKQLADAIIGGDGSLLSNLTKDDLALLLS